jgi:hypothetical protein
MDGLPQKQFIGGAEGFGSAAGADRGGAVWGAAREVDVDGGREGGGGRGGGFGPGTGARFTGGGGSTAPQSALGGSSERVSGRDAHHGGRHVPSSLSGSGPGPGPATGAGAGAARRALVEALRRLGAAAAFREFRVASRPLLPSPPAPGGGPPPFPSFPPLL